MGDVPLSSVHSLAIILAYLMTLSGLVPDLQRDRSMQLMNRMESSRIQRVLIRNYARVLQLHVC